MEKGNVQKFLSMEISSSLKNTKARNLAITMFLVGDAIFRIESTRSLNFVWSSMENFVWSSMERPARVSHMLLEILEFLEGKMR